MNSPKRRNVLRVVSFVKMTISNENPVKSRQYVKKFKCDICDFKTYVKSNLTGHINGVHLKVRPLKCDKCDFSTAWPNQLCLHKKEHGIPTQKKIGKFKCDKCDHVSPSQKALKDHMTRPDRPHVKCDICSLMTTRPLKHMKEFHKSPKRKSNDEMYNCEKCDYTTTSKYSYNMHGRTPHYKCEVCSFTATQYKLSLHKKKLGHGLKEYNCDKCRFKTNEKRLVDRHKKLVHRKDKYKCDKCDYATSSHGNFHLHKRKPHIKCKVCSFVATNDTMFKRHMTSWHSTQNIQGTNNYDATENPLEKQQKKGFSDSLQDSQPSLTELDDASTANNYKEGNLPCNVDEAEDNYYWTLDDENVEDKDDNFWSFEEISFSCLQCDFIGSSESDTEHHKLVHEKENGGIRCEECPFVSKSRGGLTSHMAKIHSHLPNLKQMKRAQKEKEIMGATVMAVVNNVHRSQKQGTTLQCEECPFISSNLQGLSTHKMAAHNPELKMKCNFCDFVSAEGNSNRYREIVKHLKEEHADEANINRCDLCDHVSFNRKLLHVHKVATHLKENDRKCHDCDFYSVFLTEMNHHKKDVHNMSYDHVCKICGKDFLSKTALIRHKRNRHSSVIMYHCSLCNFKCKSRHYLQRHSDNEHQENEVERSCQFCDFRAEDLSIIEKHMSSDHTESSKEACGVCAFSAYHIPILKEHKKIHDIKCKSCSFTAECRRNLQIHIKKSHNQKQIQCTLCNFSSTTNSKLRKHAKDAHGLPYDHVCDICGKDFSGNSLLENHKLSHSGIKDVKCNLCIFETNHNSKIKIHYNYVHRDLKMKLKCKYCSYEVPTVFELETSFKHTNTQLEVLEAHIKDLHGDIAKPLLCSKCQFTTFHEPALTIHLKSLHETKCQLCGFESATMKGLRLHIDTAHIRPRN